MDELDELYAIEELHAGMTFASAAEALCSVQDYALAGGKSVKVEKRSGIHHNIVYSAKECEFFVRAYRKRKSDKTYGCWYISSMNKEHINCTSQPNPTRRQIVELPTFASAVRADGDISASALTDQIQSRDGISLVKKTRTLHRAQDTTMNPGSVTVAEKDDQGRFKRALVIVKVFADAVKARQGVLSIDCAHSKCPSYTGQQIHLVGRDGNMQTLTLAFALVETEDIDNYTWFFRQILRHGFDFAETPLFCDRNKSIIHVAQQFGLNLTFCTLHILRNVVARFAAFKKDTRTQLSWIALKVGADVKAYLEEIPPERWCVFTDVGAAALYGWRTSSFVESVFGTQLVKGMRSLHPYAFIQAMSGSFVDATYNRSQQAALWEEKPRS